MVSISSWVNGHEIGALTTAKVKPPTLHTILLVPIVAFAAVFVALYVALTVPVITAYVPRIMEQEEHEKKSAKMKAVFRRFLFFCFFTILNLNSMSNDV